MLLQNNQGISTSSSPISYQISIPQSFKNDYFQRFLRSKLAKEIPIPQPSNNANELRDKKCFRNVSSSYQLPSIKYISTSSLSPLPLSIISQNSDRLTPLEKKKTLQKNSIFQDKFKQNQVLQIVSQQQPFQIRQVSSIKNNNLNSEKLDFGQNNHQKVCQMTEQQVKKSSTQEKENINPKYDQISQKTSFGISPRKCVSNNSKSIENKNIKISDQNITKSISSQFKWKIERENSLQYQSKQQEQQLQQKNQYQQQQQQQQQQQYPLKDIKRMVSIDLGYKKMSPINLTTKNVETPSLLGIEFQKEIILSARGTAKDNKEKSKDKRQDKQEKSLFQKGGWNNNISLPFNELQTNLQSSTALILKKQKENDITKAGPQSILNYDSMHSNQRNIQVEAKNLLEDAYISEKSIKLNNQFQSILSDQRNNQPEKTKVNILGLHTQKHEFNNQDYDIYNPNIEINTKMEDNCFEQSQSCLMSIKNKFALNSNRQITRTKLQSCFEYDKEKSSEPQNRIKTSLSSQSLFYLPKMKNGDCSIENNNHKKTDNLMKDLSNTNDITFDNRSNSSQNPQISLREQEINSFSAKIQQTNNSSYLSASKRFHDNSSDYLSSYKRRESENFQSQIPKNRQEKSSDASLNKENIITKQSFESFGSLLKQPKYISAMNRLNTVGSEQNYPLREIHSTQNSIFTLLPNTFENSRNNREIFKQTSKSVWNTMPDSTESLNDFSFRDKTEEQHKLEKMQQLLNDFDKLDEKEQFQYTQIPISQQFLPQIQFLIETEENLPKNKSTYYLQVCSPKLRCQILDWVMQLCSKFQFQRETLYHSIYLFDNFVYRSTTEASEKFDIAALCSLFISQKHQEMYPLSLEQIAISSNLLSKVDHVIKKEQQIIEQSDWRLDLPTACTWLNLFMKQWDEQQSECEIKLSFRNSSSESYANFREVFLILESLILNIFAYNKGNRLIAAISMYLFICKKTISSLQAINNVDRSFDQLSFFNQFNLSTQEVKQNALELEFNELFQSEHFSQVRPSLPTSTKQPHEELLSIQYYSEANRQCVATLLRIMS